MTLEEALKLIQQLTPVDKIRLIERIAPKIERELLAVKPTPRKSYVPTWDRLLLLTRSIEPEAKCGLISRERTADAANCF